MDTTIVLPSRPRVVYEDDRKAEIVIEGLYPGYGTTIGNALRRVLISSLPGSSVISVRIRGIGHEFTAMPGITEDTLTILLNIKKLRFRIFSENTETITLDAKGECEIKGKDLEIPSNLELVNENEHIATLTKKDAKLSFDLTVEPGVGYITRDELKVDRLEAGLILLDEIFTPVRKVSYEVENMRVGASTNYNRLKMSIETDGTIKAKDAFLKALDILRNQLDYLTVFEQESADDPGDEVMEKIESTQENEDTDDVGSTMIGDLKISSRTIHALDKAGLKTVGSISDKSEADLASLDGIGDKALQEIHRALGNLGITLRSD